MVVIVEERSSRPGEPGDSIHGVLEAERPRPVGPGRLERGYRLRIEVLERNLESAGQRERRLELETARAAGELEVAARLERGLQRLVDRQEERLETAAQREKRLALALGAVQRENELLRERLELLSGPARPRLGPGRAPRAAKPARRGLWARITGRGAR